MTNSHDFLPMTSHVSALVRRITMRLSAYLAFHQHKPVTPEEGLAMFDLAEASQVLDQIATLPGMAQAEERARRDLLDLYDVFYPVDLEATQEQPSPIASEYSGPGGFVLPCCSCDLPPGHGCNFPHCKELGQLVDEAGDAQGCQP